MLDVCVRASEVMWFRAGHWDRLLAANGVGVGEARIERGHVVLPLANPVSDAKLLTGRQKPITDSVLLFVEVTTEQGLTVRPPERPEWFDQTVEQLSGAAGRGYARHPPRQSAAADGGRMAAPEQLEQRVGVGDAQLREPPVTCRRAPRREQRVQPGEVVDVDLAHVGEAGHARAAPDRRVRLRRAVGDEAIDRRAAGTIEMKQYSTERPRYAVFALTAAALWCAALLLRFTTTGFEISSNAPGT